MPLILCPLQVTAGIYHLFMVPAITHLLFGKTIVGSLPSARADVTPFNVHGMAINRWVGIRTQARQLGGECALSDYHIL